MGFSIELLNTIRANASDDYQARIPEATRTNIADIGEGLSEYAPLFNEYQGALINKIGKTMIETKLFKNKLARFKKGKATPHDVEEIFIEMSRTIKHPAFEPSGGDFPSIINGAFRVKDENGLPHSEAIVYSGATLANFGQPDVKALYHRQNRQDIYPVTIGDLDFKRVFRSEGTHDEFVTGLINSLYSGANYDEWLIMKELIGSYSEYFDYEVPRFSATYGISEEDVTPNMERFLATVRKASMDISFPSETYNGMGVKQWVEPKKQVLLIHKDVMAETDVTTLAKCFNVGHMDFPVDNIIVVDDFGSGSKTTDDEVVYAILIDEDIFRIWDTLFHFEPQRNALGLYTNYFLHVHQIMSLSKFKNAVRFVAPAGPDSPM